ncbi:MAG: SCO family protein [Bacteroidota bacterium]|nr:SCO family protein [Candidatus Kapabacteria bacterium]MCS7302138.1 SCO family protein [Candidatus Kapabacteria bacterium]MCX7936433.1 SCO family protein [Chlorobiota bacterium]MDW8074287.1 SCO family protein [Bacteroidota bacterium]MDW8271237.1 SCO family protein [Bacteroidota bacterium]
MIARLLTVARFLAIAGIGILVACQRGDTPAWDELPTIKKAPSFAVVNYDGKLLSSEQLKGKPWVASFMFATCQGVCPIMNTHVARLQQEVGDAVRFVSFTVDPETDSLPALAHYAHRYGARQGIWFIARTTLDSVRMLSRDGFLLSDPKTPDLHSARLVLVDEHGMIRGYFNSLDSADIQRLQQLLAEYVQRVSKK